MIVSHFNPLCLRRLVAKTPAFSARFKPVVGRDQGIDRYQGQERRKRDGFDIGKSGV
jgi:hypothetical protein